MDKELILKNKMEWFIISVIVVATVLMLTSTFQSTKSILDEEIKSTYEKEIAIEAFLTLDRLTSSDIKEVDCLGSYKIGVTCSALGNTLYSRDFKTKKPLPEFRLHAIRDGKDFEIIKITGTPAHRDNESFSEILNIFRNPISE